MKPKDEIRRIQLVQGNPELRGAFQLVSEHFAVLQTRSQLLVSLITITLTITGFSGPAIAAKGALSRFALVGGLAFALASAVVLLAGILDISWLTADDRDPEEVLVDAIRRRDRKTRLYRVGLVLLSVGLSLYGVAVAAFLL